MTLEQQDQIALTTRLSIIVRFHVFILLALVLQSIVKIEKKSKEIKVRSNSDFFYLFAYGQSLSRKLYFLKQQHLFLENLIIQLKLQKTLLFF